MRPSSLQWAPNGLTVCSKCDKYLIMPRNESAPITDLLRRTIAASGVPLLVIQRETGVQRASIMRFLRGEQSLRLDVADKLAAYFGMELVRQKGHRSR